jgi:hypothetical protein
MVVVGFMGIVVIAQDGQENILKQNITGTQNENSTAGVMIKGAVTTTGDIFPIILLVILIFIVLFIVMGIYAITRY